MSESAASQKNPNVKVWRIGRWFIAILILFGVLIGVNLAYDVVAQMRPTLSGAAGESLYAAGFDGFTDEWQQYAGRESAAIEDSTLRLSIETGNTIYSAAQPHFADFDLRVTTRAVEGDLNNAYGVVFRLQEAATDCDMPLQILCDISNLGLIGVPLQLIFDGGGGGVQGFYMFLISSDGYYSLWRGEGSTSSRVSAWIPSDAINIDLNENNVIRVVARNDTYQFFINDQAVDLCIPNDPEATSTYYLGECLEGAMQPTFVDSSLQNGQIGVVVDTVQTGITGIVVEFDDVIVLQPSDDLGDADQS